MSLIKTWLHDKMEKECREDEMFYNADMHYEIEQAMRESMDEPKPSKNTEANEQQTT